MTAWRLVLAGCAALTALAGCTLMGEVEPTPAGYPIHGIDVARFQGAVDWPAVRRSGVDFVWIKATEGGDGFDPNFTVNWAGARAARIPAGAYHFFYFCRPVADQIAWFFAHVPATPDALPPVLDIEWTPLSPTCTIRPPRSVVRPQIRAFLSAMKAHYGKQPLLYTTVDFYHDIIEGAFEDTPLWVRSTAGFPTKRYGDRSWVLWQYTATGHVPGVGPAVDRNVYAGTSAQWRRFLAQRPRAETAQDR